jgi:hypothetical protein
MFKEDYSMPVLQRLQLQLDNRLVMQRLVALLCGEEEQQSAFHLFLKAVLFLEYRLLEIMPI